MEPFPCKRGLSLLLYYLLSVASIVHNKLCCFYDNFVLQNLDGNKDTFTVKYHKLVPDTVGRYVKIIPKSWNNGICSRMELYGCAG